jgi:hypothetical protein
MLPESPERRKEATRGETGAGSPPAAESTAAIAIAASTAATAVLVFTGVSFLPSRLLQTGEGNNP